MSKTSGPAVPDIKGMTDFLLVPSRVIVTVRFSLMRASLINALFRRFDIPGERRGERGVPGGVWLMGGYGGAGFHATFASAAERARQPGLSRRRVPGYARPV